MTSRVRGHDSSVARGQGQKGEFPDCEARMIPARRMGEEGAELILQTWPFMDNLMPARDASQRKGWHRLQDREREGKGHDISSTSVPEEESSQPAGLYGAQHPARLG